MPADMIEFKKVLETAREAYKSADSDSMRKLILEQVSNLVRGAITVKECLHELHRIQDALASCITSEGRCGHCQMCWRESNPHGDMPSHIKELPKNCRA
jgi:hypothetical protein